MWHCFQLTTGCGAAACDNEHCASSGRIVPKLNSEEAAARALISMRKRHRLCCQPTAVDCASIADEKVDEVTICVETVDDDAVDKLKKQCGMFRLFTVIICLFRICNNTRSNNAFSRCMSFDERLDIDACLARQRIQQHHRIATIVSQLGQQSMFGNCSSMLRITIHRRRWTLFLSTGCIQRAVECLCDDTVRYQVSIDVRNGTVDDCWCVGGADGVADIGRFGFSIFNVWSCMSAVC